MRSCNVGVNMNLTVVSDTGAKRTPLDIRTRDYVLEKYNGLPEQELKYVLHPFFQIRMKYGIRT